MGPSRHTRAAAAASAGSLSHRNDESAPTSSSSPSRTPVRPSPYARTPTKPSSSSALTLGPSTPTSRTSSPMMLREIFSMISPFRGLSRARRSAAFGAADEEDADQDMSNAADEQQLGQPSKLEDVQDVDEEDFDEDDRMIEDAEEGVSQSAQRSKLEVPNSFTAPRSPSPRPRSSSAAPPKALPLADSTLVTPGLRRQFADAPSTPGPSTSYAPPTQTSPVSRNYDLLARFFSEKQRGGQGGLTEVEVEGCIRLIEESMASGRNLESEFVGTSNYNRTFAPMPARGFAPSSRASSIAPAFPSSQSTNTLFHPGTSKIPTSSSAYSFLAPRAPAARSAFGAAPSTTRRRPIYLGPGMSGLSLNRRRPVVASASRAAALAKTPAQSFLPRSSTDPNLAGLARQTDDSQELSDRAEEAKRRRTAADAAGAAPSTQGRGITSSQTVQFEPNYEKEARQSSLLAEDIAASSSSTNGTYATSPLKRGAPSTESAATASTKTSPPKATTRTASAIQDILKATPPVRPPTKPELINPYQSAAPLAAKSKSSTEADSAPVRRSARTSMLTRAKARETARAAEKLSPPKESVLDLIERTAPKTITKRKAASVVPDPAPAPVSDASASADRPSAEERKLQKTEEVQRRLEALSKSKGPQQQQQQSQEQPQQSVSKPTVADPKTAKVASNLVPPQYTATKPKKPSPLSAAFQAPDSPSSDSETAAPVQPRGPAISQPTFSFGNSTAAASVAKPAAPSTGFSFSAPKPASTSAPSAAPAPAAAAPSSGFSFSKPAASASEPAKAAPAPSTPFSFSPVTAAPAQQKPAASSSPASTGFSFSAPSFAAKPTTSSTSTSTAGSSQSTSVRDQVLAEDASKLPQFDWQVPAASAPVNADQALRDEIKSVAQAALPKFDFIYDIDTSADKGVATKAATPSTGFSFSAPAAAPVAANTASAATTTDAASEDTTADGDDPSKPSTSGLLGEGEGEESERTLFEVRAKIWRLDVESKQWKDLGVCIAKIKHDSTTNKNRLLARNEANGKVAVNFMTYKGLKTTQDKAVNTVLGFDGSTPTQYRMKVKTEDSAAEFKRVLEDAAPKA